MTITHSPEFLATIPTHALEEALRARGYALIGISPGYLKLYELKDGPVPMTDLQAVSLGKELDYEMSQSGYIMEQVWFLAGKVLSEFREEQGLNEDDA